MKIKKYLQDYIEKMENDSLAGEIAIEVVKDNIKEARADVENKKKKKQEKERAEHELLRQEALLENYQDYVETARKSAKKAKARLAKVGLK